MKLDQEKMVETNERVTEGRTGAEKNKQGGKGKDKGSGWPIMWLFLSPFILILLAVLLIFCSQLGNGRSSEDNKRDEKNEEVISVTEAAKGERSSDPPSETGDENKETEMVYTPAVLEDNSWQEVIFGKEERGVISAPLKVSGLTETEKLLMGFRESDFIRSLSSFLSANNLHVSGITFENPIAVSAGDGEGYSAALSGVKDKKLIVISFPRYQGKYLFALLDVPKEETPVSQPQSETQAQVLPAQEAPAQSQTQSPAQSENVYDAMDLTVKAVPGELSNYLSNPYELQYALYDYLYENGKRGERTASVSGYEINSDERSATIRLSVEGAGKVTCVYQLDSNSYEFS